MEFDLTNIVRKYMIEITESAVRQMETLCLAALIL